MKIINNQDLQLINEIKELVNINSIVSTSCNHLTAFALFELVDSFAQAKHNPDGSNIRININEDAG